MFAMDMIVRQRPRVSLTAACVGVALLTFLGTGCRSAPPPEVEPPGPPLRGLDFEAEASIQRSSPARLVVTMTMRNRRSTPAVLTFPNACLGLLRVYEDSERSVPVWEQPVGDPCPASTASVSLMPGVDHEVILPPIEVAEILGSELAAGTYRITVVIAPGGQVLEIQAGEAELARPRPPRG
jgi:hypothetical protein